MRKTTAIVLAGAFALTACAQQEKSESVSGLASPTFGWTDEENVAHVSLIITWSELPAADREDICAAADVDLDEVAATVAEEASADPNWVAEFLKDECR